MADVEWIKLYLKSFRTSRKMSAIERMKNGDTIIVIWFKLLCLAGEINDGGAIYITPKIPFDEISLADELKKPCAVVKTAIKVFEEHDMVLKDDVGFIRIANWEKYQSADKLAEIRAKDRERKRQKKAQEKALSELSTDIPRNFHGISTDIPYIEEEGDEEGEKEFSFIHSIAREEEKFIEQRIEEAGLEGRDADAYREELKDKLKLKYMTGTLGQGVVFMSDEQFYDLCDKLTMDELDKYFSIIVDCEKNGKRYRKKTHYQAILEMAAKDRKIGK